MSAVLGKRKRRAQVDVADAPSAVDSSEQERYQALLRRHFESAYEPLAVESRHKRQAGIDPEIETSDASEEDDGDGDEDESDHTSDGSGWEGFSGDEDEQTSVTESSIVEVIDHSSGATAADGDEADLLVARKSFMSSKLPSSSADNLRRALKNSKSRSDADGEAGSEMAQMANDLALQRLLRESKLLASGGGGSSPSSAEATMSLQLTGRDRHRATDEHLRTLGAKGSLHSQKSMPRSQRMGIVRKAVDKEATRRREARDAGVVLEKARKEPSKAKAKRRERGMGAPGVGRFRGGTLTLSAKDVRSIQGPPSGRHKGRGKAGGKGRR